MIIKEWDGKEGGGWRERWMRKQQSVIFEERRSVKGFSKPVFSREARRQGRESTESDLMTHDLLRQTSKPRIPPPIPVRVESRIRRSSTLLSLPSYIDFLSSVGSRLSPSSFPPSLASNDNVSFVWIRFDLRVYRVINIELILCSMLLGYIKYYSNSFFIYLGNWD